MARLCRKRKKKIMGEGDFSLSRDRCCGVNRAHTGRALGIWFLTEEYAPQEMLSRVREALKGEEVKIEVNGSYFWRSEGGGTMKEIYLLRHGDTDATEKRLFCWLDRRPSLSKGRKKN